MTSGTLEHTPPFRLDSFVTQQAASRGAPRRGGLTFLDVAVASPGEKCPVPRDWWH